MRTLLSSLEEGLGTSIAIGYIVVVLAYTYLNLVQTSTPSPNRAYSEKVTTLLIINSMEIHAEL